jgi:predicted  nucleic acid-binding Zn-ribbon protein
MENRDLMIQILQNKKDGISNEIQKIDEKIVRLQDQKGRLLEKISSLEKEVSKLQTPKGNNFPKETPKSLETNDYRSILMGTLDSVSPRN